MPISLSGSGSITGVSTLTSLASLDVTGSVSVGGVLTYDDVTNIDSVGVVTARAGVKVPDNQKVFLGTGDDLQIYHDGSHSYIDDAGTGNLYLRSGTLPIQNLAGSKTSAVFNSGGGQELYHNNSKKFETTSNGIDVTGEVQCDSLDVDGIANIQSVLTMQSYIQGTTTLNLYGDSSASQGLSLDASGNVTLQANLDLQDNDKILLGNGDDLDLYHDTTDSYLRNQTGQFLIRGNDIKLQSYLGETYATLANNNAVSLYYDNSKKLETTSGGVTVTGTLIATANVEAQNNFQLLDSKKLLVGNANDLQIYHNGSGNYIDNTSSTPLYIRVNGSETAIFAAANGKVGLNYDGSGKFETTSTGAKVTDQLTIGSGSSANSEYGLIAYANSNSLSNRSAVYARNIGGGRNFTGDNSAGATTCEVYSSGSIVSTQSSSSEITSYNTINSGTGSNRILLRTQANQGGDPYIKFDAGGSNMIVGEWYNGTTNNKLVLGVGEDPTSVSGLSIDGNGNGIYGNGHQSTALAVDNSSNRGINFTTGGRIYCKTDDHWDLNHVGTGEIIRFRKGQDTGSGSQTGVGNITINSSSVSFNNSQSDIRLKKNIESWTDEVLPHFKTLQPKKFHFNWQSDEDSLETGYVAQDLVGAFPDAYPLCKTEVDGEEVDRYAFNPSGMVKYLMKALQEEIAKREALEARIAALEGS